MPTINESSPRTKALQHAFFDRNGVTRDAPCIIRQEVGEVQEQRMRRVWQQDTAVTPTERSALSNTSAENRPSDQRRFLSPRPTSMSQNATLKRNSSIDDALTEQLATRLEPATDLGDQELIVLHVLKHLDAHDAVKGLLVLDPQIEGVDVPRDHPHVLESPLLPQQITSRARQEHAKDDDRMTTPTHVSN